MSRAAAGRWLLRTVLWAGLLLVLWPQLAAQPYTRAPKLKRPVWKIIEWKRSGDQQKEAQRGGTSTFDRQGRLINYAFPQQADTEQQHYVYDAQGRLLESREGSKERRVHTRYVYKSNMLVRVETFHEREHKIFSFFKAGRKVEEKFFVKGEELGEDLVLKDRVVFNYDGRDSLTGEMHYAYPMRGKREPNKRKVLYQYEGPGGRRSRVIRYDFDGTLQLRSDYGYDAAGRLQSLHHHYPTQGPDRIIEYKYQKGQLWQIIESTDYRKYVRIFKEGRLIRSRSYQDDLLISIIDYQYLYFKD
ncbi:MAG: hypothetical protein AAGG75_22215 [Bacteroidota bacterium]